MKKIVITLPHGCICVENVEYVFEQLAECIINNTNANIVIVAGLYDEAFRVASNIQGMVFTDKPAIFSKIRLVNSNYLDIAKEVSGFDLQNRVGKILERTYVMAGKIRGPKWVHSTTVLSSYVDASNEIFRTYLKDRFSTNVDVFTREAFFKRSIRFSSIDDVTLDDTFSQYARADFRRILIVNPTLAMNLSRTLLPLSQNNFNSIAKCIIKTKHMGKTELFLPNLVAVKAEVA